MALELNLTSNCAATASLYNALQVGNGDPTALLRQLLQPSLDVNFTDAFISTQIANDTYRQQILLQAGEKCQEAVCTSLAFTGNADIAGIGSMVAYGLMVMLASLFFIVSVLKGSLLNNDVVLNFWDGLLFLQIMTQAAFWAYLPRMRTLYEFTIAQLITRMISCSTLVTMTCTGAMQSILQTVLWNSGLLGALAIAVFGIFASREAYIDLPCQESYKLPLLLVKISACLYISFPVVIFFVALFKRSPTLHRRFPRTDDWLVGLAGVWVFFESLLMWATFGLIILVRQRAKVIFEDSYEDNALGYGQIMAAGLSLQTIVHGLADAFKKLRASRKASIQNAGGESTNNTQDSSSDGVQLNSTTSLVLSSGGNHNISEPSLSPSRSRTSNMEDGLSPAQSQTSIQLQQLSQHTNSTARDIDADVGTLQKRPTFF